MAAKKKILIVDDNVDFVKLNTATLEAAGYEVEAAYNAEEGFTKVEYGQPDAIVLDLMMERHDSGFKLAEKLKTHPVFRTTPILMLTAVGQATGSPLAGGSTLTLSSRMRRLSARTTSKRKLAICTDSPRFGR